MLTDQALPAVLCFFTLPPGAEQEHGIATKAAQQLLAVIRVPRASLDQEPGQEQTRSDQHKESKVKHSSGGQRVTRA